MKKLLTEWRRYLKENVENLNESAGTAVGADIKDSVYDTIENWFWQAPMDANPVALRGLKKTGMKPHEAAGTLLRNLKNALKSIHHSGDMWSLVFRVNAEQAKTALAPYFEAEWGQLAALGGEVEKEKSSETLPRYPKPRAGAIEAGDVNGISLFYSGDTATIRIRSSSLAQKLQHILRKQPY